MSTRMAGQTFYSTLTGDNDTDRNYREGNWAKGQYDADALATKFGLDRSKEGRGDGHVWGMNPDGSEVYIGFADDSLRSNQELIKAHGTQRGSDEADHTGDVLSSAGDVKGALLALWKADGGGGTEPAPVTEPEGIVYSDKAAKAKAGVAAFENTILPYQGDYIMGKKGSPSENYLREYALQLNEYRKPRDPNQIDGPVYNPQAEEAAVAGFGDEGLTAYDLDFDKDRDLYYS